MNIKELERAVGVSRESYGGQSDYAIWSENHYATASSKSSNPQVLKIYHQIMENLFSDSDYWTCGNGNEDIATQLYNFDECDWIDLEHDLVNWKLHQLKIFCNVITAEYDKGSVADEIVIQRSYLYGYLLTIVDFLSAIDFMDELKFLKAGEPKPQALLNKINGLFDKIEETPLIIGNYLRKERFDYLKLIITEVNSH